MSRAWPAFLLALSLAGCVWVIQRTVSANLYTDFAMLHQSAVALRTGTDLYVHGDPYHDGNLNPPHVVAAMLPLARLPLAQAAVVGWVGIALSMIATAWLLRTVLPPWWLAAAFAVVLASPAGYLSVRFVNLSWPLALGVTWAWLAMRKGQSARAGAILGALATIKLFLLLFVPYFAWRRQWRPLAAGVVAAGAVCLLGMMVTGVDAYAGWVEQLRAVRWQGNAINVSVLGALQRTLDPAARGGYAPLIAVPALVTPLWVLSALAITGVMALRFRGSERLDREWAAVLVAALLLSPLGWSYYWAMVVGPMAAAMAMQPPSMIGKAGLALCLVPFFMLGYGQPSPWLTITLATSYTWGGLLVWWSLVAGERQEAGTPVRDGSTLQA